MEIDLGCDRAVLGPAAYFAEARANGAVQWSAAQRGWVVLSHEAVKSVYFTEFIVQ